MADHMRALETRLCEILAMKDSFAFGDAHIVECLSVPFREIHAIVMRDMALCTTNLSLDAQMGAMQLDGAKGRYIRAHQSAALCAYTRERIIEVFPDLALDDPDVLPEVPAPMMPEEHIRELEQQVKQVSTRNDRIGESLLQVQAGVFGSMFGASTEDATRRQALLAERQELEHIYRGLIGRIDFYRAVCRGQEDQRGESVSCVYSSDDM